MSKIPFRLSKIRENTSDSNLVYKVKSNEMSEKQEFKLKRRYTSKSGKKEYVEPITMNKIENIKTHQKTKSKQKGRISKIKLRNPTRELSRIPKLKNDK